MTLSHESSIRASHALRCECTALVCVGLRRLNYMAHWLAYAVAHKTTKHAAWSCAHKGLEW